MGVDITTIDYLRVLIIEIGSTIILMVVEAQGPGILASLRLSFPKEEK